MIKEIKTFVGGPKALPAGGNSIVADTDIGKASAAVDAEKAAVEATQEPTNTPLSNQIAKSAATPATGITNQDLFPGMNQNINVGSSSSKTLGSQPIFVAAGQYVPYNILNKKEEAIAAAAKKRAERQAKFDPGKAGKLNNQLYQRKLNDRFNKMNSDFIRTAQSMDPDNWDVMLNDPGSEIGRAYAQQKSNYEVLATESNVIFDKAAAVMAAQESGGDTIYSEATKNLASQVDHMTGSAAEGGLENLRPFVDKLNGSFDLDKHLANNKVVAQMKADITSLLTPEHGGLTVEEVSDWSKRIEAYAESETANSAGRYHKDNIIKKQDIVDRLSSMLGVSKTKTHKQDRATSAAVGKGKDLKARTEERYRIIKKISLDTTSEEAKSAIGGLAGSKFGGNVITAAKASNPEDYQDLRDASTSLTEFYNQNKDATEPGKVYGTNPVIESSEFKKDLLDRFNNELSAAGVDGIFTSVEVDKNNTNLIHIVGEDGLKETVDMSKKDALEDHLLGAKKAAVKNKRAIELKYEDNGIIKTKYVSLEKEDPESFELLNTMLNVNIAEAEKIDQGDLRKLKLADQASWAPTAPPATLEELKSSGQYDSSVARTMKDAKVGKDEAIRMIEEHYNKK